MQAKWQILVERFVALSLRERILVLVAVFVVAYQIADLAILDRQHQRIQQLEGEIARDRGAIVHAGQQMTALSAQLPQDPNARLRSEIERVRAQLQSLQAQLREATRKLISPQDMARFLEELLVQERELTLLRLQTLDVQPLGEAAEGPATEEMRPALHRHGFEIEFAGGYFATLRYLEALEALPWRFFWDSVDYEVVDYPRSIVRLKLHTLSMSEDWIGV